MESILSQFKAYRYAAGPAGFGVEVLVDGKWLWFAESNETDTAVAEFDAAGIPRLEDVLYW